MQTITVEKTGLIETLAANQKRHVELYQEALAGYREQLVRVLGKTLARAEKGKRMASYLNLPVEPESHETDYQTAIEMLAMATETEIKLSEAEFRRYVRDNWDWQDSFVASNSGYLSKSTRSSLS